MQTLERKVFEQTGVEICLSNLAEGDSARAYDPSHPKFPGRKSQTIVYWNNGNNVHLMSHYAGSMLSGGVTIFAEDLENGDCSSSNDDIKAQVEWMKKQAQNPKSKAEKQAIQLRFQNAERARQTRQINAIGSARHDIARMTPIMGGETTQYMCDKGINIANDIYRGRDYFGEFLCVPARRLTKIVSSGNVIKDIVGYQKIYSDGRKMFLKGFSPKGASYETSTIDSTTRLAYLVEGWATGVSVSNPTGIPCIVAWNAGNLKSVAEAYHSAYPDLKIIGLADKDDWLNKAGFASKAGFQKMAIAMNAINSQFILPNFDAFITESGFEPLKIIAKPTDFCDLVQIAGINVLLDQLENNPRIPEAQAKPIHYYAPAEMSTKIGETIENFFDFKETTLLKASAGGGKTTQFQKIAAEKIKNNPDLKISCYMPTHEKAAEMQKDFIELGVDAIVLKGRAHVDENGDEMCQKYEAVQELINAGGAKHILKKMCCDHKKGNYCEHYNGCKYLQQFEGNPNVIIFQHAHLPLWNGILERKLYGEKGIADFNYIDEDCTQYFERHLQVSADAFKESKIPDEIKETILSALEWNRPLLGALRNASITSEQLLEAANELKSPYPKFGDINPSLSEETALKKLSKKKVGEYVAKPLKLLAEELNIVGRNNSHGVSFSKGKIHCYWIADFERNKRSSVDDPINTDFIPTLITDASASPRIINKLLDMPEAILTVECYSHRNAKVTQLQSSAVANVALRSSNNYLNLIAKQIDKSVEDNQLTLVIGPQEFVGNPKNGIYCNKVFAKYAKNKLVDFAHFGALRGLNKFSNFDNVIVVGRHAPPTTAHEASAKAWFRLDDEPLQIGSSKKPVSYNMRNGSQEFADVFMMNDYRAQIFMDAARSETEQGIDRLRTIFHEDEPKEIFIFSNTPIQGIEVDKLVTIRDLKQSKIISKTQKTEKLIIDCFVKRNSKKVLPYSPKEILKASPETFTGQGAAKGWLQRTTPFQIMETMRQLGLNDDEDIQLISYSVDGIYGKRKQAVVLGDINDALIELSKFYGGKVCTLEGILGVDGNHLPEDAYQLIFEHEDAIECLHYLELLARNHVQGWNSYLGVILSFIDPETEIYDVGVGLDDIWERIINEPF